MNGATEQLLRGFKPTMAVVVYSSEIGNSKDFYLESHEINGEGKMMEGKPLMQQTLNEIVDVFFDDRQNSSKLGGFIPENLLQYELLPGGNYQMVWWQPAQVKHLFFAPALKIKSGLANVPALIYKVERRQLSVFFFFNAAATTEKTVLYRAPFHNVDTEGMVCLGSAKVKKPVQRTYQLEMKYWEDMFWLSEFTHLNGATNPTKTKLDIIWRKLIGNKRQKWDSLNELKASKEKFKNLFE